MSCTHIPHYSLPFKINYLLKLKKLFIFINILSYHEVINVASRGLLGLRKMGRKTWFDDDGMKKGEWTAEEDQKLVAYINEHGLCDWRSLPERAGIYRFIWRMHTFVFIWWLHLSFFFFQINFWNKGFIDV